MLRYIVAVAAAAILSAGIGPAAAAPPAPGLTVTFALPLIVCASADDIRSIAAAGVADPGGGSRARFNELRSEPFAAGEGLKTRCGMATAVGVVAGHAVDLGIFPLERDLVVHGWAVQVSTSTETWWLLLPDRPLDRAGRSI